MLKFISRLVCLLPYPLLLTIGGLLGRLYYVIAPRQRERALDQIQEALGISRQEAETIIRRLFINLGRTVLEVMYIPALTPEKMAQYVEIENRHYLEEALAKGKGVTAISAHVGNWEWLGAALAMAGFPLVSIIKRQPNDQYTRILNEYRQMAGMEVTTRGTTELIAAAKSLKKGKVLGFLCDQDAGVNGLFIKFLGKMASTPTGVAVFSRKFGASVVPMFIVRRPEGGHRIIIKPPLVYDKSDDEAQDIVGITTDVNKIIEETIRQYPDEWLWFQKRWNTEWRGEQA
jgi:KDO2-lipid IV(A) lauroyltransferase